MDSDNTAHREFVEGKKNAIPASMKLGGKSLPKTS